MYELDRFLALAADLFSNRLAPHVPLMVQREHDGADHRDEQNESASLEQIDVARVEDLAESLGVAHLRKGRRGRLHSDVGRRDPGADDQDQLDQKKQSDSCSDRQIFEEARPKLGKVDVEHHHHEQKQHEHGADIDHDKDHRQEFGAKLHEQAGGIEESEDQEQHGVNR